jgi:hypothetical protein
VLFRSCLAGRLGAGIAQLAGKRSFYAGVAVGAAGSGALALALSKIRPRRGAVLAAPRPVIIGAGAAPRPSPARPGSNTVKGKRANPKPIPMSGAAPTRGTRANPKPIPMSGAAPARGAQANPRPIPVLAGAAPATKLQPAAIRVKDDTGQFFTAVSSFRVLRPDGADTGLAITPALRQDEAGQITPDTETWHLTHAGSGLLIGGPYRAVSQAHGLARKLAGLDWTQPALPPADLARAQALIAAYQPPAEEA